ncbi:DNA ligase D [Bacillus massiliglaciei]|uniref:DNA ligase D n=1 Tax=Bacillus massiliglaciei TaxID=1816693 RepID=UPI000B285E46|nr:DNA ligase D [Bacillus massiliglaciei]
MKPMLPTYRTDFPKGTEWQYEIKYDGFRAILRIEKDGKVKLDSRNEKELLSSFPEIKNCLSEIDFSAHAPLTLDGELVWLENEGKGDFGHLQWRGRLKTKKTIEAAAEFSPCRMLVFDMLEYKGENVTGMPLKKRKNLLNELFIACRLPLIPDPRTSKLIQLLPAYEQPDICIKKTILLDGEGVVAKLPTSTWEAGKRTETWVKIKNWRTVPCFISSLDKESGYLSLSVFKGNNIVMIGKVKNGFTQEDRRIISELVKKNAVMEDEYQYYIQPSICLAVHYLHAYKEDELREPVFSHWLLDKEPDECTWETFLISQFTFPESVTVTSPDKPIWQLKNESILKIQLLQYLRQVSCWFLPFLQDRALTNIRFPHGTLQEERFFQKNIPDYAPSFIQTGLENGHEHILCNNLETLLWLGNQLALEFHTPFQKIGQKKPDELVLDLDPASPGDFPLAIKAARAVYDTLKPLNLAAFVKTSGNKGLQVHIPLPDNTFTYKDTRIFTDFLASYLTGLHPEDFTIERLKKKRKGRLYLDFVQHSEGKTIITPYSPRGNHFAGVAAPLFWEEVNGKLKIEDFNLLTVPERIKKQGCPFTSYREVDNSDPFREILSFLKKKKGTAAH